MYERRIAQLATDCKDRGVSVIAIEPNDSEAITIDELDSSDIRVSQRRRRKTSPRVSSNTSLFPAAQDVDSGAAPRRTPKSSRRKFRLVLGSCDIR